MTLQLPYGAFLDTTREGGSMGNGPDEVPQAGWYDNPEGEGERYWDGSEWTDQDRDESQAEEENPPWWQTRAAALGAVVLALIAFAVFAPDESEEDGSVEQVSCDAAPANLIDTIADGLDLQGGGLEDGRSVTVPSDLRNSEGWPARFIAARITGPGMGSDVVGVWATDRSGGAIIAVNAMAQEFSTWGSAAQPGSPMAQFRDQLARSDTAEAAEGCPGG